jgi:hypothetical protein
MDRELALRITVLDPPPGVTFCLQRGKTDLVPPAASTSNSLSFDFSVRVRQDSSRAPNFLGPFTQGPPQARFVYVNSGTLAGQADSCWTRRGKVPLSGLSWELIEQAIASNSALEARIAGTAKDGGPACATVPLLDGGWQICRSCL